jgi:hypothetical protein
MRANTNNPQNNFNRKGAQRFCFFENRKERKALRPLRNIDKEMKIFARFAVNKRVR